jgi:hypothetical protein
MKKIGIYIFTVLTLTLGGCTQSFLNTSPITSRTSASFYQSPSDAAQALTAMYSVEPSVTTYQSIFVLANQMSDDCLGGGGQNDHSGQYDQFQTNSVNAYESPWATYYQGINRANTLISKFNQIKGWSSDAQRSQALGEAHFMRAYFYFNLMRMFGGPVNGKMMGVPCFTDPNNPTSLRSPVDTVYALIASDLKLAIDSMPAISYPAMDKTTLGHATKWAAEALMARVFLFYNGQAYGRTYSSSSATMPLTGGGKISNSNVVTWIDDCVSNSGFALIRDFRDLWPYSYTYSNKPGDSDYGYTKNNGLQWIEGYGTTPTEALNTEDVFSVHYSNFGGYSTGQSTTYCNTIDLYQGWRNQTQIPFGDGWGDCTVVPTVYSSWDSNDLRKQGSICDVNDATEGISGYVWGSDKQWNETGYWQKKYIPININTKVLVNGVSNGIANYSCDLFGTAANYGLDNTQNVMYIRFADVLLMAAELGSSNAQADFDQVHGRAYPGYVPGSVPATLANIQLERRHELAFEGIRYWDELRWGTLVNDLTAEKGAPEFNAGVAATYDPTTAISRFGVTKGFLQIPQQEISLSNEQLVQNDGWNSGDASSQYNQ